MELLKSQKIKRVEVATQGLTEAGSYFHLKAEEQREPGLWEPPWRRQSLPLSLS